MSHGFTVNKSTSTMFRNVFPIENRQGLESGSNIQLKNELSKSVYEAISDFHFLVYLSNMHVLDTVYHHYTLTILFNQKETFAKVCSIVKNRDQSQIQGLRQMGSWKTLEMILESRDMMMDVDRPGKRGAVQQWSCTHCTFVNEGTGGCEMCGLPAV